MSVCKTSLSLIVHLGLELHPFKLYKCHSYSSVRASYFANRVINVWNTLPSDHADFSSFAAFKRTVQQIDLSTFLLC